MIIQFEYEGDVSWLSARERKNLETELNSCTRSRNWDYFNITDEALSIGGKYDNEEGYCSDHEDIEIVLNKYDVDWQGGIREIEYEPDWDSMPGGYDTML